MFLGTGAMPQRATSGLQYVVAILREMWRKKMHVAATHRSYVPYIPVSVHHPPVFAHRDEIADARS